MFSKGEQLARTKVLHAPGPSSYPVVNPGSQPDTYGLEKTDRFTEAKPSEVPGSGSVYQSDHGVINKPHAKRVVSATNERYAALQRQLEGLERIHTESSKTHKSEMERLKQELSRVQKLNSEHTSRVDKLKKQNDSLDAKLQETRKQNIVDQAEIKELRTKLRVSENERGHLALKSEKSGDAKKSLAILEVKRKEELLEREKRIVELEKSVANEQRRNEVLEGKLLESEGRSRRELEEARETISSLRGKVASTEEDVKSARAGAGQREEELIAQLESARAMIQQIAQEYGRLASSTVPRASYDILKQENSSLQLSTNRLQGKFVVADAQAKEMTELLRVSRDQNHALEHILNGVWADLDSRTSAISGVLLPIDDGSPVCYAEIEIQLASIALDVSTRRNEVITTHLLSSELFTHWHKTLGRTLLHDYSLACTELSAAAEETQTHQNTITVATMHVTTLSSQLEAAQLQSDSIQRHAGELSERLETANARVAFLKEDAARRGEEARAEKQAAKERLERERETVKHLQTSTERQKFAEEEMRNEISMLSKALSESEGFAHAYQTLVDEVNALVDRNALAEEEAEQLSKFNAELLSHKNPAQKIMYVDRIRQELAETKQKLLLVTRERDNALGSNETLQKELGMYTAVTIPTREKPRTTVTRVTRMPLSTINP